MMADKKPAGKAAKAPAKKSKSYSVKGIYEVSGEQLKRKNKTCPKCGPGTFLGDHQDRWSCGSCGYMEKKK